jgi:hypothetical protein
MRIHNTDLGIYSYSYVCDSKKLSEKKIYEAKRSEIFFSFHFEAKRSEKIGLLFLLEQAKTKRNGSRFS